MTINPSRYLETHTVLYINSAFLGSANNNSRLDDYPKWFTAPLLTSTTARAVAGISLRLAGRPLPGSVPHDRTLLTLAAVTDTDGARLIVNPPPPTNHTVPSQQTSPIQPTHFTRLPAR
ncbi:hypothetical protein J6590_053456 [Homalodisca vitripennis]|nr:hypothetical protein J6590_053456 [Homalodisca vitripennis]